MNLSLDMIVEYTMYDDFKARSSSSGEVDS